MGLIIGTAGHIDHGKTSLVKALTGQDTDRLKEEKERGITIDLGFAHLDLPGGGRAGVVDVPGHERFIRNMLAGAHGIDLVLFTVAADDGVMPQTEEHLDILHVLGVRRAIFVVTKIDLVPDRRIAEVEEEIRMLAAGTSLADSPVVRYSFATGSGLDEVRGLIALALRQTAEPRSSGYFRLPVDRAFVLRGHGLVVTGTATGGMVRAGDHVRCLPGPHVFRVRNIEVHNQAATAAMAGQRVALNLAGHGAPTIQRGHVICDERLTLTSARFDAWLELRPSASAGLKNHQRLRVHQGTAERMGRAVLFGSGDPLGADQSAYCQIALDEPLHLLRGDHFIVRDETAQRTLGGGIVVAPWARRHRRTEADVGAKLERLHRADTPDAVAALLEDTDEFAVPSGELSQFLNLEPRDLELRLASASSIRAVSQEGEPFYTSGAKWRTLSDHLTALLGRFHAAHPLLPGMDIEAARDALPFRLAPRLFRSVVDELEAGSTIAREGNLLRLPGHTVHLRDEEHQMVERIKSLLGANPVSPPDLPSLERQLGLERAKLGEVIRLMERQRAIVRVSADLYFLAESLEGLTRTLRERWTDNREITPAAFRDAVGTTRKYAIPLLEYFDRTGITIRRGETRRLRTPSRSPV
jgi:selenocysteine-specific elongation factor